MPNSNKALQVAEYANVNKSDEYNTAMYEAFFFGGINIGLVSEIKKIAVSVGISGEEVDQVFATDKYRNILDENKKHCRDNNITSVPTFIINDQVSIVGAQSSGSFKNIFKKLENGHYSI